MVNKFFDAFLWLLISWLFPPNSTHPDVETQTHMFSSSDCCQRKILPNSQKSLLFYPQHGTKFFNALKSIRTRILPRQTQFTMYNLCGHQSCTVPYTTVPRAQKQAFWYEHSFPLHSAAFPFTLSHFAKVQQSVHATGFVFAQIILTEKYILCINWG